LANITTHKTEYRKMTFRSEVRDGTINALLEKARERSYGQYLARLTLKKVRGFIDQSVSFDFPVTAVIGPNGGGKTTVLGAAAIVYRMVAPRTFFAKSGNTTLACRIGR
jgi:predicted ATPase